MPAVQARKLLALAMPMMLARATQAAITFADLIQIKHLGTSAMAAVSNGGLNVFGVAILAMGSVFIVQSFVAQLVGRGEHGATRRYAWYGLAFAAVAAIVSLAAIPAVGPLLGLANYAPDVHDEMTRYMSIRLLSMFAIIGVEALGNWYGGLGNTWMQMVAGAVTMVAAIVLNAILIPLWGVAGAAWASTIASWLGFAVIATAFALRLGGAPNPPEGKERTPLSLRELARVVRFGLPNGVNWFFEMAAFQLFVNGVMGGLGTDTVAALSAVLTFNSIAFMPSFGLASAGAILAGQAIGSGNRDGVWPIVKLTLICAMSWMGLVGLIDVIAPRTVLSIFDEPGRSGDFIAIGASLLAVSAAWQLFDAINMTFSETLRAAGDTVWTAAVRLVVAWFLFTPAAFVVVYALHLGAVGAMLCLCGYLAALAGAFAVRFRGGAWRRIQLIEPTLV